MYLIVPNITMTPNTPRFPECIQRVKVTSLQQQIDLYAIKSKYYQTLKCVKNYKLIYWIINVFIIITIFIFL